MVRLEDVKNNPIVSNFILKADSYLEALGYTEHGFRHANLSANIAMSILRHLNWPEKEIELAGIAGYMHDMGNLSGREGHPAVGSVLAFQILQPMGMEIEDIASIMSAIGNHDEPFGIPASDIGSAVILADKTDIHRSRVRVLDPAKFDIHDRVNHAVTYSFLRVEKAETVSTLTLELTVDTALSSVMDYFEISFARLLMCRKAAEYLHCQFHLDINKMRIW
jgi:hypothetical protein